MTVIIAAAFLTDYKFLSSNSKYVILRLWQFFSRIFYASSITAAIRVRRHCNKPCNFCLNKYMHKFIIAKTMIWTLIYKVLWKHQNLLPPPLHHHTATPLHHLTAPLHHRTTSPPHHYTATPLNHLIFTPLHYHRSVGAWSGIPIYVKRQACNTRYAYREGHACRDR